MSGKRPGGKPAKKPGDPEKVAAKRDRRAKAAALREEQKRKERRKKILIQIGTLAVVAAVAIAVTIGIMKAAEPDYVAAPEGFNKDGEIFVGNPDAPVTLTLVEDFQCPHCAATHAQTKDLLDQYAEGDDVKIAFQPVAFLDSMSSTDYSTRALNAAVCVAEEDPDNWFAMHNELMENQPAEGGDGLPDDQLVEMAVKSGADSGTVSTCVDDLDHEDWIKYATNEVTDDADFQGTPSVFVNGERVDPTKDAIESAVNDALAS